VPPRSQRILLLPDAEKDLRAIADPLFSKIVRKLQLLRQFPEMGAPMAGPFEGWRAIPVGIFRIIYHVAPRGIEIAYIRHCKRKFPPD
jgi:plasmid stabilization system protein ParE